MPLYGHVLRQFKKDLGQSLDWTDYLEEIVLGPVILAVIFLVLVAAFYA